MLCSKENMVPAAPNICMENSLLMNAHLLSSFLVFDCLLFIFYDNKSWFGNGCGCSNSYNILEVQVEATQSYHINKQVGRIVGIMIFLRI